MEQTCDKLLEGLSSDLAKHFQQLVLAYQNWVYAFALRQTGNAVEAEDVMQEVFLQVYVTLENYPAQRIRALRLKPWLAKIALYTQKALAARRVMALYRSGIQSLARRSILSPAEIQVSISIRWIGQVTVLLSPRPRSARQPSGWRKTEQSGLCPLQRGWDRFCSLKLLVNFYF